MTPQEQALAVDYRRLHELPRHSPPHFNYIGQRQFFITATCFEHRHHIGLDDHRLTNFEADLMSACAEYSSSIYAWCVLPNHYHLLVRTECIKALRRELGLLHGRTSYAWNGEEDQRGRQIWFNCLDRLIRSHRHFWATMNYIHNNPVKHGYVDRWQDWIWSSGPEFLERMGYERTLQIWREFPILDYGKKWDFD
ncbi:MAG TPA: transposase [Pyrinomonadaceae bacterium]|nr:transposase [Pyrinomonadaceae bacterium]